MAKQLMAASIAAPAFYGLNTQESGVTLQEGFALHANNCVIDKYGRLGARKGWITQSTSLDGTADANDGIDLVGVTSFKDIAGTDTFISWSDDTFYSVSSSKSRDKCWSCRYRASIDSPCIL